jgi:ATP-dependent exoDNAse (exonuclease V) beta subunit
VGDRVLLMTVHQSKGLEYPLVVVPNADVKPKAGTFLPHRTRGTVEVSQGDLSTRGFEKAQEDEEAELRAENLRLLYVACTRAQDALVFPWQADTKEDGFLHPVVEGWDWEKDVDGTIRHLSCGTDLSVAEPSDDPGGRDPLAYRMAYDPSEVEGPEAEEWAGKFSARDEARREEVQRHLKTPRHRTAHEQDFEDARPLTRDDTPSRTASPWGHGSSDGFAFGRLVHRLLEWSGRPEVDRGTAGLWAKALGMSAKRAEEAFQAVQSWEASDLGKRLRASTQVFRELPVTLVREGESRDGRIDLAFLEDGKWVLVDYKTDRDMEERTEQYGTQLRFYAGLLEEATGRRVKEAWLVFVRPGGKPPVVQRVDL